jgi:hypothetical protein
VIGNVVFVQQARSLPKWNEFPIDRFQHVDGLVHIWVVKVGVWNIEGFFLLLDIFLGTSSEKAAFRGCYVGDRVLPFEGRIVQGWRSQDDNVVE